MKIKYFVTPALLAEMKEKQVLSDPSYCDSFAKRFKDDDMCHHYYGLESEHDDNSDEFYEIATYDDQTNSFLVNWNELLKEVKQL